MKLPKSKNIKADRYIAGSSSFGKKIAKIKLSANESALGPSPKAVREYNKVSKNFCSTKSKFVCNWHSKSTYRNTKTKATKMG